MDNVDVLIQSIKEEKNKDRRYMVTITLMVILCAIFGVAAEMMGESPIVAAMPLGVVIGSLVCWTLAKHL